MWYCDCPQCNGTVGDYYPFDNPEEYALWEYLEYTEETRYPDEDWYEDVFDNPYEADELRLQEMIDYYGWAERFGLDIWESR